MAPYSLAVKKLGILFCQLCSEEGTESNPLTRHHCDGDAKNNDRSNFLVVHRWRCHTFADSVTQLGMHEKSLITPEDIIWCWNLIHHSGWLLRLMKERRR